MLKSPWRARIAATSGGLWRDNPGRIVLSVLAIAAGVALGVAVHLINASALNEIQLAARSLAGEADLVISGPASGFDEQHYARIARMPEVRAAAPALEFTAQIAGTRDTLRVVGIDPLRSMQVQPRLFSEKYNKIIALLNDDRVLLSASAATSLALTEGGTLHLRTGTKTLRLEIAGVLESDAHRQPIAFMDIATAQWRFERVGQINRIDIRLHTGVNAENFAAQLQHTLPAGVHVTSPAIEAAREASLTRAYRLNLDMLALVALLTGAYLVYATQTLSALRRRTQFALLRALGMTRAMLAAALVGESVLIGIIGSALGVAGGYGVAALIVHGLGTDLGAGYFRSVNATLHADARALLAYFALGVLFAALGAAAAAFAAGRRPPAAALHAGDEESALVRRHLAPAGITLAVLGATLTAVPPIGALPLAGYAAIALILLGAVMLTPSAATAAVRLLPAFHTVPAALAAARLQATPRQLALGITAILVSFSLVLAMLVMVTSFRTSLAHWLTQMLPADLYLRASRYGETGFLTAEQQALIAATPGVRETSVLRTQNMLIQPDLPRVTLIARYIDTTSANTVLPLNAPSITVADTSPPPAWISEIIVDVYGYRAGQIISLPIAGKSVMFTVAGIWRDYTRQGGAVVIDRDTYIRLTGDTLASEIQIRLAHGANPTDIAAAIQQRLAPDAPVEITNARDLHTLSLGIFDRTFAVTYALEAAAALIGLFGLSAAISAQTLTRRREFSVLRHLGMTARELRAMIGCEGMLTAAIGAVFGLVLGLGISLILIAVINRQSFHWSMDVHIPWPALAASCAILIAAAGITALLSARRAMDRDVLRAAREDW